MNLFLFPFVGALSLPSLPPRVQGIREPRFDGRRPHGSAGRRWTGTGLGHYRKPRRIIRRRVGMRQEKWVD